MILWIVWWAAGMVGGFILWLDWRATFPEDCGRCPSRKGALLIFLGGALGAVMLAASLVIAFFEWVERRPKNPNSWWNKPIC